jgi:hypothetical protein
MLACHDSVSEEQVPWAQAVIWITSPDLACSLKALPGGQYRKKGVGLRAGNGSPETRINFWLNRKSRSEERYSSVYCVVS